MKLYIWVQIDDKTIRFLTDLPLTILYNGIVSFTISM